MARPTVKLLLVDEHDRVLLIRSRDPLDGRECWYPVGGGVEPGESLQEAAAREAREETGLEHLPPGRHVWTREHTYAYAGRRVEVHEDWLLHRVASFEARPAALTAYERRTIRGFRWWPCTELTETTDTVFPPRLGARLASLLADGAPSTPVDISG